MGRMGRPREGLRAALARYDPVVAPEHDLLRLAADWRPQRPGRRSLKDVDDALVEPHWEGLGVVVALTPDRVALVREGLELTVPAEIPEALRNAFTAEAALVEARLTTVALRSGEGGPTGTPDIARPSLLVPRFGRKRDDPYLKAREFERREIAEAPALIDALAGGERHVLMATDLLYLDGTTLHDVPLLERKRLLDGVIDPAFLVRVTPFVRADAFGTLVAWGSLGFTELHYRAANSRYVEGAENPDCVIARPPDPNRPPSRTR